MNVTLNDIEKHSPCKSGWQKLLKNLGKTKADDEPLPLVTILDSNGLNDALWCLRALPPELDGKIRLFNCLIAEHALKYWEAVYPDDKRPHEAIAVSRRFAVGKATQKELEVSLSVARSAARSAQSDSQSAALFAALSGASDARSAESAARSAETTAQEKLFREYWA